MVQPLVKVMLKQTLQKAISFKISKLRLETGNASYLGLKQATLHGIWLFYKGSSFKYSDIIILKHAYKRSNYTQ